jgi:hypothetical protein
LRDLPKKLTAPGSAAAVLLAALCLAYAGDAGHGFIKDDLRWIRETRVHSPGDFARLFERSDGFYRPLVSVSFALNSATSGLAPKAYGLTNLALVVANAALIWLLARRLRAAAGPALLAAGVWAFNFHGINMAVLWISGRTSLLVTTFALLTAIALTAGRVWLAGLCCLLALLSKEEAALLPLALALWSAYDASGTITARIAAVARRTWPCFAALAIYLALRVRTDAFWPAEAPSYYRLTFSPSMLATNIVQYVDRAITWPAVAALALYAASAWRARFDAAERRILVFGGIWLVCTFGLTVFVPVRSSLYAVLPSVGSALAAGAVASAALRAAPQRATAGLAALALLPLLLLPAYWQRNERWVRLGDLSAAVLSQVRTAAERQPGRPIVLLDDPTERFNLEAAFGNIWPDAAALFLPPQTNAIIASDPPAMPDARILRLEGGRLVEEN